ncbi:MULTISPECIES: alpha/beta hydrolase [Thalassospira]|uniref:Alpha/beta hydrolase n=2 Tax=Thalassospira TaxID=168934 RepID=A0A367WC99_9PROT|nr:MULTISPECIES: alpha/beta hydrolase [Thalassospira]MDG4717450.1 alpha/beta hydrolase [Thalassospira sp. FZY0004]RCK39076.1 alpha/beta hydrolase [Thalassospira profundimaris]
MRVLTLTTNVLVAAFLLTGCDKLGAYNYWQAGDFKPDIADLSYGEDRRQKLDLYLPDEAFQPAPLLIWFYGGSWDSGDKTKYSFVAKRFTELGYAVAIPDYRLVPNVHFPAFIKDSASAIAFMKNYANENVDQIKTGPVVLAGHSAGAYNAVQVVADPVYLGDVGLSPKDIAAIIGLSGPYDFYPYDVKATQEAFGDTPAKQSQPVEMDLSHMPPLLLITGNRDHTVFPRNSRRLAELAPNAKLVEIEETGHAGTLISLGFYLTTNNAVLGPVTDFLGQHLQMN